MFKLERGEWGQFDLPYYPLIFNIKAEMGSIFLTTKYTTKDTDLLTGHRGTWPNGDIRNLQLLKLYSNRSLFTLFIYLCFLIPSMQIKKQSKDVFFISGHKKPSDKNIISHPLRGGGEYLYNGNTPRLTHR